MKTKTFLILLVVFFVFALWLGRVSSGLSRWPDRVDFSYAISVTVLAAGGILSALSCFLLLRRAINGEPVGQSLPLILALLGALLLYQPNWGVAIALGIIVVSIVLAARWPGK